MPPLGSLRLSHSASRSGRKGLERELLDVAIGLLALDERQQRLTVAGQVAEEEDLEDALQAVEGLAGLRVVAFGREQVELGDLLLEVLLDAVVEADQQDLAESRPGR